MYKTDCKLILEHIYYIIVGCVQCNCWAHSHDLTKVVTVTVSKCSSHEMIIQIMPQDQTERRIKESTINTCVSWETDRNTYMNVEK